MCLMSQLFNESIVEQYDVLFAFFTEAVARRLPKSALILSFLGSSVNKTYSLFLNFILPEINKINEFFQKRNVIQHKIKRRLQEFYKLIAGLFLINK